MPDERTLSQRRALASSIAVGMSTDFLHLLVHNDAASAMFADRQVDSTIVERARRIVEQRVMISRRRRENKARRRREAMVGPLVGDDPVYIPASDGAAASGMQQESREEKASRMREQHTRQVSASYITDISTRP